MRSNFGETVKDLAKIKFGLEPDELKKKLDIRLKDTLIKMHVYSEALKHNANSKRDNA